MKRHKNQVNQLLVMYRVRCIINEDLQDVASSAGSTAAEFNILKTCRWATAEFTLARLPSAHQNARQLVHCRPAQDSLPSRPARCTEHAQLA
jgi:hypothetical protein